MTSARIFEGCQLPIRESTASTFREVWQKLGNSGPNWSGRDRMDIIREARASLDCKLCEQRLDALSPNAVTGDHDTVTALDSAAIEVVHRLRTDPARMTKSVFKTAMNDGLTDCQYVELVGVVATSVIIDTLHQALGLDVPDTLVGSTALPTGEQPPADVVEAGAWVRIAPGDGKLNEAGIPRQANIVRSMGLVPSIIALFFAVMREAYFLVNLPISISRSQAEFIAARVSALNQCFY